MRSERTQGLVQSEIRAMTRACDAVGGVNLGQGICDTPTPEIVKAAAVRAITAGRSIYTPFNGIPELRDALATKLETFNGIAADPEEEIVVTVGSSAAYACALQALFDPGDELVLFEPFYGYHLNAAKVAGIMPRFVRLDPPAFALDIDALRSAIGPRTRAILVNTPMNPCGKVFDRDELVAIAELCQEHNLVCLTDEVYEYLVYADGEHVSMATLDGMRSRTVTMASYSKTFSITGWRIGYAFAPPEIARAIGLVHDLNYICAPHPLQWAVARGIAQLPASYYSGLRHDYETKRDRFCAALREVGLDPIVPEGSYYVLADVSSLGAEDANAAAMRLLDQAGVAGVPGSAFFGDEAGEGLIRFCYAKRDEALDRAIDNLRRWRG